MEHRKDEQQFEESSPQMEPGDAEMAETEAGGAMEESEDSEVAAPTPLEGNESSGEAEPDSCRTVRRLGTHAGGRGSRRLAPRRVHARLRGRLDADHDDRLIALLCYVTQVLIPLVMPVIVLLSASSKKRPFQRFHAVQSLALSLTFILFGLLMGIGSTIIALVPVIGWLVVSVVFCLSPLLALMGFLALAYYGYQAYQGKRFAIPGLTSFLQDQNWI